MTARFKVLLAVATVLVATLAGIGTNAAWRKPAGAPLGTVTAGTLDITAVGPTRWTETSPDVSAAPHDIDPASFLATAGDRFQVSQDFTTALEGENLRARLRVSWGGAVSLPAGVSATYVVNRAGSQVTGTTPVGAAAEVGDLGPGTQTWTVLITVSFASNRADRDLSAPVELSSLGEVLVDLDQVRQGTGFGS